MHMPVFFQFLMSGLVVGAVYALIAVGFTLIYNASDVANFAQGEFVMIGGMVTSVMSAAGVPLPLAGIVAVSVAIASGLLLYWFAVRPVSGAPALVSIIITIGASILMRGIAESVFDKQFHKLKPFTGDAPIDLFGAAVQPQAFWVLGGALILAGLVYLFLEKNLLGKALLATAANGLAARLVGINTGTVMAVAFGGSAAIGAVAGILATPITLTSYDVGTQLALKGLTAATLGGMRSPFGAFAGGLMLGLLEAFASGYISSSYKDALAFVIMLLVLLALPQGLFGGRSIERV